ncbi:MAG: hypothetical protein J7L54_02525 [Elusimicrobia bacterium]|nr:hypothetical protein [Elusimicrobiota bacterium]
MAEKEVLIANLRKQLTVLEEIPTRLEKAKKEIRILISELEDESMPGTPPPFDRGKQEYSETFKKILGEIKYIMKILKQAGEFIQPFQRKTFPKTPASQELEKD